MANCPKERSDGIPERCQAICKLLSVNVSFGLVFFVTYVILCGRTLIVPVNHIDPLNPIFVFVVVVVVVFFYSKLYDTLKTI